MYDDLYTSSRALVDQAAGLRDRVLAQAAAGSEELPREIATQLRDGLVTPREVLASSAYREMFTSRIGTVLERYRALSPRDRDRLLDERRWPDEAEESVETEQSGETGRSGKAQAPERSE